MNRAIGMIEYFSVAAGIKATDEMLDSAAVELLFSMPVCPGKYFVMCAGEVSAVQTAVNVARNVSPELTTDWVLLPNVDESIFSALTGTVPVDDIKALGVIETFTGPGAVTAADIVVKAADIKLIEIRLCKGLGGKAYALYTGDVSACESATRVAVNQLQSQSLIVSYAVIPSPNEELIRALL